MSTLIPALEVCSATGPRVWSSLDTRMNPRVLRSSRSSSANRRRLSPLRGSKRLHQLSKMWADSGEFWGLAGVQALGEFMKYDADLWRKASAYKGLRKSASYCFQQ